MKDFMENDIYSKAANGLRNNERLLPTLLNPGSNSATCRITGFERILLESAKERHQLAQLAALQ